MDKPFVVVQQKKLKDLKNVFLPSQTPCYVIGGLNEGLSKAGLYLLRYFGAVGEFKDTGLVMIAPLKDGCVVVKGAEMIQEFLDKYVFRNEEL